MSKLKAVPRGKDSARKRARPAVVRSKSVSAMWKACPRGLNKTHLSGTRRKRMCLTIYKRLLNEWNLNKTLIVSRWFLSLPKDRASSLLRINDPQRSAVVDPSRPRAEVSVSLSYLPVLVPRKFMRWALGNTY